MMEFKKRRSFDDAGGAPSALRRLTQSPRLLRRSGIASSASSVSSVSTASHEHNEPLGCMSHETSHDDCNLNRFIVWVAVKRNSCQTMNDDDRRMCPMARCRKRLPSHEDMLQHLFNCDELTSGEYWCYYCDKTERFSDAKCKRCIGHPSKRRKLMFMAKNFFTSIGNRSKNGALPELDLSDVDEAPPSYNDALLELEAVGDDQEIHEIDSYEIPLSTIMEDAAEDFTETSLHQTLQTGMPFAPMPVSPRVVRPAELESQPDDGRSMMERASSLRVPTMSPLSWFEASISQGKMPQKPSLQLHTAGLGGPRVPVKRSTMLGPSTSVRSTASTDTNASTDSSASYTISPMSQWSDAWAPTRGFESTLTSPDDDIVPTNPFRTSCQLVDTGANVVACDLGDMPFLSELPASIPELDAFVPDDSLPSPSVLLPPPVTPHATTSWDQSLTQNLTPPNDYQLQPAPSLLSPMVTGLRPVDAHSLVASAWNAMQLHVAESKVKLGSLRNNHLAEQLISMSPDAMTFIALDTLVNVLDGILVESPTQLLCLIHLVYSFSLIIHEQDAPNRVRPLFTQALSYASHLSRSDRQAYVNIVATLWKPQTMSNYDILALVRKNSLSSAVSRNARGKEPQTNIKEPQKDSLVFVAQYFLDELEYSVVHETIHSDIQSSTTFVRHMSDIRQSLRHNAPLSLAFNFLVQSHTRRYADCRNFTSTMDYLSDKINSGHGITIRQLELDLIQAGKICLQPETFLDDYVPLLRSQMDSLYEQTFAQFSSRALYNRDLVALIRTMIPSSFEKSTALEYSPPLEMDPHISLDDFLQELPPETQNLTFPAAVGFENSVPFVCFPDPLPDLIFDSPPAKGPITITTPDVATPDNVATAHSTPSFILSSAVSSAAVTTPSTPIHSASKVESDHRCNLCGYRPEGDPRWFGGSMAKHKKLQHSQDPPVIYSCPFPGCTSQYRNRPDNLRQHQLKKGHFVDDHEDGPQAKRRRVS